MKISIGADERLRIVEATLRYLEEKGHQPSWHGPAVGSTDPWPQVAVEVAREILSGEADEGILFCWTGTGVSIAANKIPGIRAALCVDAETARGARLWNNANVLCMSMRLTSESVATEILDAWFSHRYEPNPTDDACLAQIEGLDSQRGK